MCGIAGVITKDTEYALETVKLMTKIVTHRGPDGEGFHCDTNFVFGHRRLNIIDLSDLGKQPMGYLDNIITYNGEVYNYIELKEELLSKGYQFASKTDTEVILAAYDCWGEDCVTKFNGMWSFALYDKKKNSIFCSRDRFGIKPFYYTQFNDRFYFASEIKQFTVLPGWTSKCNKLRAHDYFKYGISNHTTETMFSGVFQLKGGDNLIFDLDAYTFQTKLWYIPVIQKIENIKDIESVTGKVKELFFDSVLMCLRSDVKVGTCLSGGIDSSAIVCSVDQLMADKGLSNKLETVSACYTEKEYSEEPYINIVTNQTKNIAHKVIPSFDTLFGQLDKIIWHQDEPFQSTSIFAQWNVFKAAAANNITVMVNGQGADEYLAGYENFYGVLMADYLAKGNLLKFGSELKAIHNSYGYSKTIRSVHWLVNVLLFRLPFISENFRAQVRHKISRREFNWLKLKGDGLIEKMKIKANTSLQELSCSLLKTLSIPTLMQYEDRNSMAFSIESRMPFLDYRLVEYILSLPNKYKIHQSKTKYVFREAMKGILPEAIRNRKDKIGFATPQEKWVKGNSQFFRKKIEESCDVLSTLIDKNAVLKWYDDSIRKDLDFEYNFWDIICFAHWVKIYNVELPK
jgi:asparagine synthase (glutamine-hydrolysing)